MPVADATAAATSPVASAVAATGTEIAPTNFDINMPDFLRSGANNVSTSLQQFGQKLSAFLSAAIDNAASLEVSTYTSDNMSQVSIQGSQISGAQLRAVTVVRIDGDIKQVIPVTDSGDPDVSLWDLHLEMVRQAQASRTELLRAAIASLSSLTNLGGVK